MSGRLPIGLAATTTNEDLPLYIVNKLARKFDLARMNVAILGMAFKANSDDTRASLSYKLKRLLRFHAGMVLTSDPLVKTDAELVPLEQALGAADLVIIGVPHDDYRDLQLQVPFVDIWNVLGKGSQL
jgi:UDP-N-acetyl-D-mannosaminuronic acid dehydrogenase